MSHKVLMYPVILVAILSFLVNSPAPYREPELPILAMAESGHPKYLFDIPVYVGTEQLPIPQEMSNRDARSRDCTKSIEQGTEAALTPRKSLRSIANFMSKRAGDSPMEACRLVLKWVWTFLKTCRTTQVFMLPEGSFC